MERKQDFLDRLVIFLAKRDGIDKLVKTLQYTGKLSHWHLQRRGDYSSLASRAKSLEVACGLSRKAFRLGRWLTGLNNLRATVSPNNWLFALLSILANAGEMVYFFFDHFTWLSRIGVLDPKLATKSCLISASGEAFGYIFFVIMDTILIATGVSEERRLAAEMKTLLKSMETKGGSEESSKLAAQVQLKKSAIGAIRMKRIMQAMAIAANVADFVIALADIEPNPFVTHAVTLGISGLVSAWAGWYRNWPSSP